MLTPSRRLLAIFAGLSLFSVVCSIWTTFSIVWWSVVSILLTASIIDAALLFRLGKYFNIQREVPHSLALGIAQEISLHVSHQYQQTIRCEFIGSIPEGFESDITSERRQLRLLPGQHGTVTYIATPVVRGRHQFEPCDLRLFSPLGLWSRQFRAGDTTKIHVYPNFAAIVKYHLLATDHRLGQLGILVRQRRGEGLDFRQLREYREGDSRRQIDWKASSRMRKLISREYQDEKDQQVVFLLDCGRRMQAQDGHLSHFDHTLNAMLLLSYVALRQGDAVGLSTFATQDIRYLAPKKSDKTVNLILNQVFDLQPSLQTSDYYQAAIDLTLKLKKRALIVILSNLRDEDDATLLPALQLLQKKHLVIFASLQESSLLQQITSPIHTDKEAIQFAANCDFLNKREQLLRKLNANRTLAIETPPEKLAIELVNQYLDLKMKAKI